jgi:hypothetical protein
MGTISGGVYRLNALGRRVAAGAGNLPNPKIARHSTADSPASLPPGMFLDRKLVSDLPMDLALGAAVAIGEKWGVPTLRKAKLGRIEA